MSSRPPASSLYATALLGALIKAGVRDVVVCPGSRSQALAFAAAEAEQAAAIRLHVRADERAAGFFALGLARETGLPAPIIVTSGSAVANLLPAALEAHEGRVPMLLLTADRPADLRGTRSNQTTRQAGLFSEVARLALDIDVTAVSARAGAADALGVEVPVSLAPVGHASAEQAPAANEPPPSVHDPMAVAIRAFELSLGSPLSAPPAGPVHLNLQFREPLSGWPAGQTFDFGAGDMTPAQLFAHLAVDPEHATQTAAGPAQPPGATEATAVSVAAASAAAAAAAPAGAEPLVVSRPRSYYTYLPDETEFYTHDGDALTVVIAGEGAGVAAEQFAREAGLPLLAEVVSGSRFGREAITAYATLIDDPEVGALTERAIVFGHPTLTRQVPALLKRDDVEVFVVDPHGGEGVDHYLPTPDAKLVRGAKVAHAYDPAVMRRWLGAWVVADRALREARTTTHAPNLQAARETGYKERNAYARAEVAVMREPVSRELLVESVWRATWPHDRLVLAASRLVRVLDGLAPPRRVEVRANRGLAGIDGTVSTALGIASASQAGDIASSEKDVSGVNRERGVDNSVAGTTRVVLGDLALLHDAGSLLLPESEPRPRVQLFVGNDGGGTIFDTLEAAERLISADRAQADAFDRVMYTPQDADFEALANAYGWAYRRVETRGELERLLTEPVTGPELVEVPLAR